MGNGYLFFSKFDANYTSLNLEGSINPQTKASVPEYVITKNLRTTEKCLLSICEAFG